MSEDVRAKIKTVGVMGCGLMGSGIVQVSAAAGFNVVVREVSDDLVKKGIGKISDFLAKGIEKGKVKPEEKDAILSRIKGTTTLADLKDCDLVIEAIIENPEEKKKQFRELDAVAKPSAIFSSNTSSVCLTEIAMATKRPTKFVGLHFFNPVPIMKLVELVKTRIVEEEVYQTALAFGRAVGKDPITAPDKPGFIVNRLLVPYLIESVRALEEGYGTIEDIDKGMTLGCGHPMGPFTLLDLVGIDTTYYIAEIMYDEYGDPRFKAPPLMKRMVLAGHWGRKTGRGFYDYSKK